MNKMKAKSALMFILIILVLFISCSFAECTPVHLNPGQTIASPSALSTPVLAMHNNMFMPNPLTIKSGRTLKIVNRDPVSHTVTSSDGKTFNSGPINQGETGNIRINKPGTYRYYCTFHPNMQGTLIVVK